MPARQPGMGRPGKVSGTRELVIPGLPYIMPYVEGENTPCIEKRIFLGLDRMLIVNPLD